MSIKNLLVAIFALFFAVGPHAFASGTRSTKDTSKKMDSFLNNLIAKMTVDEKIGQLVQYSADMSITGTAMKENFRVDIANGKVGSVFNAYTPQVTRELQKIAVEKTRLKIPLIFGYDVIHGHKTIFPIPLAESQSWDMALMQENARIAAREAAADGVHWTFAPMVDIARDPRWGRIMEGAGEDPWFGSKVAAARVQGFQDGRIGDLDTVLACVKHFAAYGAPVAGRDYNVVDMSQRELFENYLPPYKAALDAGAATVMTSFNEIAGVPSTASRWLLTDLLRNQWKFKGMVVTDYTAVNELIEHGVAAGEKEAGALALTAGVDMDMQGSIFSNHLRALLNEKKVTMAQINVAVRRVLEAKYKLGLFDDPYRYSDEKRAAAEILTPAHMAQARETARRSIVLLKNENETLPLKRKGTIAVIGPLAESKKDLLGFWSAAGDANRAVSMLDGMQRAAGDAKIIYAKGANILDDAEMVKFLNIHEGRLQIDGRSPEEMIKEAVQVAKKADVVVMAIGEPQGFSGEAASRAVIRVPENQQALLKAIKETGKPIVTVVFNGRPLVLTLENNLSSALVEAWFPGHQGGPAVADILFGDYNPSAKLNVTFPRTEGQIPIYYAVKNTGRPYKFKDKFTSKYLDVPNEPLFPFGFGLSYTKFKYSDVKVSKDKVKMGETISVSTTVTNEGARDGEEVVQLYIRDMVSSVTRPMKQLRGYQKIALKKGESKQVAMTLTTEDLKFYDANMKWVAEPGLFKVMVGPNSADVKEGFFTLVPAQAQPEAIENKTQLGAL